MSIAKRKIVLFADVLEENFDGVSVTLHKILKNIPTDQFELLIVTSHPPRDIANFPHQFILCPFINLPFQKGYRMGVPNRTILSSQLDDFAPDLIHFTSPSPFAVFAVRYGRKMSIPVMNIYHTHYPVYLRYYIGRLGDFLIGWIFNYFFSWFYRKSDLTLVPTKPIKKDLMKIGIEKAKLKVWGRAVETNAFNPLHRDENLFDLVVPKENKKVLFVSRLIKEKETDTIFKVYKKLRKADKKVTLIITGDGPKRDWLESKMPKAIFTGKKEGNDLSKIYASSDIFFFPSASETFGNVIIEAMASGLPIVSANAGGPAELIINNKTGFLVETGKSKDFCEKILQLVHDDELRMIMGQNAKNYVQSKSIDILHKQLWKIYDDLILKYQLSKRVPCKTKTHSECGLIVPSAAV